MHSLLSLSTRSLHFSNDQTIVKYPFENRNWFFVTPKAKLEKFRSSDPPSKLQIAEEPASQPANLEEIRGMNNGKRESPPPLLFSVSPIHRVQRRFVVIWSLNMLPHRPRVQCTRFPLNGLIAHRVRPKAPQPLFVLLWFIYVYVCYFEIGMHVSKCFGASQYLAHSWPINFHPVSNHVLGIQQLVQPINCCVLAINTFNYRIT